MNSQDSSIHKLDVNTNQEQRNFLNNVVEINGDSLLEIRTISQSNVVFNQFFSDIEKALSFIGSKKSTDNIFFGVSSRKNDSSGKKANCYKLNALFVDIDCGSDGHKKESMFKSKQDALDFIDNMHGIPKPSIIVDSGNGLHLYWLLKQPITFDSDKDINRTEGLLKKLSLIFGGDSAYDISRVLRVPVTFNYKTKSPKQCKILEANYNNRYELIEITNHPLLQLNLEIFKPSKSLKHNYHSLLFGNIDDFDTDDRSSIEQSLITFLVKQGFGNDDISLIFNNYPITGKYSEHNDPLKYLEHSIINAREFIENSSATINSNSDRETAEDSRYKIITDNQMFGYHMTDSDGKTHRLSNFIIEFNPRTQMVRNQETQSFYSGRIIFQDKIYQFYKLSSTLLVEQSSFAKFIAQHTGTEGVIYHLNEVIWAVKYFNRNAGVKFEREYGFTPNLDKFVTGNMIIVKDQVILEETPIKNAEHLGDNILGLINDPYQAGIARTSLIEILNKWDKPEKIYPIASFSFYSLLEPFIKPAYPKKFYMMIQGTSGSGKSSIATLFQRFFGTFDNLTPANSTYTAINNIGSALRHCLYVLDDYKRQNFKSDSDLKQASIVLQNYADNNSRKRSNKSIGANDDHKIEGALLLTGEDIVFTESSTIARGIIINVDTKESAFEFVRKINEQSKYFPAFTLQFIQYILSNLSQENIIEVFKISRKIIDDHYTIDNNNLDINNYDREANNFAALLTSWIVLKSFLWGTDPLEKEMILNDFNSYFLELMDANLALVRELRNDDYFETLLWNSIESGKLHLSEIDNHGRDPYDDSRFTYVGYYHIDSDKNISVYLNLQNTLQELKRIDPNIQVHHSTIVKKLESEGKIQKTERGKKWNICGRQIRGVKWTGNIPKEVFGIREDEHINSNAKIDMENSEDDTFTFSVDESTDSKTNLKEDDSTNYGDFIHEIIKPADTVDLDDLIVKYQEESNKNNENE